MPGSFTTMTHQTLWLLAAGGALALGVAALLVWLMMRTPRDPLSRKDSNVSLVQERAVERDMARLMDELSQMARDVGREIDQRAQRLERLIQQADERVKMLERAGRNQPAPVSPPIPENNGDEIAPDHVEIYTLADQGVAMAEIAQRLRRPNGEIELILALRPRVKTARIMTPPS